MSRKTRRKDQAEINQRAADFLMLWDSNEEHMGEQAAFMVTCEMMNLEPDEAYDLLAAAEGLEQQGGKS